MPIGTLQYTQHLIDHLSPEHERVLQTFLQQGTNLRTIQKDDKVTYELDHPDFTAGDGERYVLRFIRRYVPGEANRVITIGDLCYIDQNGRQKIVKVYH